MDFFNTMVVLGLLMICIYVWKKYFNKQKGLPIIIDYSEKYGVTLVTHKDSYMGYMDEKAGNVKIPKLNLIRPLPPAEAICTTNKGMKKLYMVKIGPDRYGYRLPSLDNSIKVYKRDDKGNILKDINGNNLFIDYKYKYVDDIIEQDVKYWEDNIQDKLKEKHRTKESMLTKWAGPISMALIFLFAIILNSQSTREVRMDKQLIMEKAEQMQADARETQENLNNLMKKITGTEILNDESKKREQYYNNTKS